MKVQEFVNGKPYEHSDFYFYVLLDLSRKHYIMVTYQNDFYNSFNFLLETMTGNLNKRLRKKSSTAAKYAKRINKDIDFVLLNIGFFYNNETPHYANYEIDYEFIIPDEPE